MTEKYRVIASGTIIQRKSEPTAGASSARATDLMAGFFCWGQGSGTGTPVPDPDREPGLDAIGVRHRTTDARPLRPDLRAWLLVVPGLLHLAIRGHLRRLQRHVHGFLAGQRRAHLLAHGDADR